MPSMARGEQVASEDENSFAPMHPRGRSKREEVKRTIRTRDDAETDSDIEITDVRRRKHKDDVPEERTKAKWSDNDSDDLYEKFKNRKSTKRKKEAATKKKLNAMAKDVAANRKKSRSNGEPVKKKPRLLADSGDEEEEEEGEIDDSIPEYILKRRREFDQRNQELDISGLLLPPRYDGMVFSDDERLEELDERPNFPDSVEQSRDYEDIPLPMSLGMIPASIAQYLRGYQVEGVAFLHHLFVYQKGGILGDDMGLGKTVQVAAFLSAAFGKTGDERDNKRMRKMRRAPGKPWYPRVLIICPGSLIQNWINELNRWGWWHIDKYHGLSKEREGILETASSGRLEIVVTTYHTYRNDMSKLNLIPWDCVVADECHQLKERHSAVTQAMNEINSLCRIGLTGTAIQNKYEELWTLLNWCNPGLLGPIYNWETSISRPLKQGQSHDATFHQLKVARETADRLVNNLLPEFFLRRMKSLIAHQLPKKTDRVVFCPLTDLQRDAYASFLESELVEIVKYSTDDCTCGSERKRGWCCFKHVEGSNTHWKSLVFPVIANLQKLSNHLALLIPNSEDSMEKQERDLEFLKKMVPDQWQDLYKNRESLFNLANPTFCGKWKVLKRLLQQWYEGGDKVLIFSHSVRLLKILQHLFSNTTYNVSLFSGQMRMDERQQAVDDFNTDPSQFIFLISTKAGGVGLNITSANKVVIFDPNWNPSYDLQAQDRAYRIGQLRDVEVFRLVSAGTVEEIVYARQIYKQQQANIGYKASLERRYFKGVQSHKTQKGELFGLRNLLTFHGDDVVLRDIVNKTNVAEAKYGIEMVELNTDEILDDEDNPLKVDDNDDEEGAMSQLAKLIEKGEGLEVEQPAPKPKPKTDPIQAILASAGVQYTHENSEVVGSSKIEAELSRRAQETGNDADFGEHRLFAESQSQHGPNGTVYEFHPPGDVMVRQFCTMAKTFGFESAREFALVVEGWTQKQRRDCLERFYLKRRDFLVGGGEKGEVRDERVREDDGAETGTDIDDLPAEPEVEVELQSEVAPKVEIQSSPVGAAKEKETEATLDELGKQSVMSGGGSETESDDDDELR
ncbi:DNA excision repair protein-like protein [Amylocarpus encephaloides]|uniref:DNA excision repair protein-like protein n=1 Tax=Amylocarpus encephaloides TaxID=45428 RepID=A0A9P7YE31_9HELO|nr:DNA excision repair protein-like protein [Amylocarpus encephaloides]